MGHNWASSGYRDRGLGEPSGQNEVPLSQHQSQKRVSLCFEWQGPGSVPRFITVDHFQLQCLVRAQVFSRWLFCKKVSALPFIWSFSLKFLNFLWRKTLKNSGELTFGSSATSGAEQSNKLAVWRGWWSCFPIFRYSQQCSVFVAEKASQITVCLIFIKFK